MRFFRKLRKEDESAEGKTWGMYQGDYDGRPLIARFDKSFKKRGDLRGKYGHQVGVAVPLRDPDSNGFPRPQEGSELGIIEDRLIGKLQPDEESIFVGVISTSGMREFVFYTTNPDGAKKKIAEVESEITTHEIQLMIQPDPDWSVYRRFVR